MATHSSILVWEIQQMEESGRLLSMGSQKSWTRLELTTTVATYMKVDDALDSLTRI